MTFEPDPDDWRRCAECKDWHFQLSISTPVIKTCSVCGWAESMRCSRCGSTNTTTKEYVGCGGGRSTRALCLDCGLHAGNCSNKRRRPIKRLVTTPPVCALCGSTENIEGDHAVELQHGGKDVASNIQWLCRPCHKKKTAHTQE